MKPLPSPLEAAQARQIKQLQSELAFYKRLEELNKPFMPVFSEAETMTVKQLPERITLNLAADARVEDAIDGWHVKAKTKFGLHIGYYISQSRLLYHPSIQAKILQELFEDVTRQLAEEAIRK